MTLTSAQQLRLYAQDQPRIQDRTMFGDGSAASFPLPDRNLTSATAYVMAAGGWSATGATFDPTGQVAFSAVISAATAFRVTYIYSNFSDDEINQFLSAGSLINAEILVVETLMFDAIKRSRWASPDGTSFDDSQAQSHLQMLYDKLQNEQAKDAVDQGGVVSWAMNQNNTPGGWGYW